jgi:hypothetical protein
MQRPLNPDPSPNPSELSVGRRQLLKALVAGGVAAGATLLPNRWGRPIVEVGALPPHAQVSVVASPTPTAVPLRYSGVCDSTPGGGDINLTAGSIRNIQPRLAVTSGTGPVQGIPTTMSAEITSATAPTFNPALPQVVMTDATGRAIFGDLAVAGAPGQSFFLVFTFATLVGTVQVRCGEFFFGLNRSQK